MGTAAGRIGTALTLTAALALGALPLCLGLAVGLWGNTAFDANHLIGGPPGYLALSGTTVTMQLLFSFAGIYLPRRGPKSASTGRSRGVHVALVGLVTVVWMGWAMGMLAGWPVQSDSWAAASATTLVILSGGVVAYAGHTRRAQAEAAAGPRSAWMQAARVAFWWMLFPTLFLPVAATGLTFHAVWPQGSFLWPLPAMAFAWLHMALAGRLARWLEVLGARKGGSETRPCGTGAPILCGRRSEHARVASLPATVRDRVGAVVAWADRFDEQGGKCAMALRALACCLIGAFAVEEPFDYPDGTEGAPRWFTENVAWEIRDGAMTHERGDRSFAILEAAPHGARVTVETSVRIEAATGDNWKVAGAAIRRDGRNFWHLALIASPDDKRYVELSESLDGQWLAHSTGDTTLTATAGEGGALDWEYDTTYRLALTLDPDGIDGQVFDAAGARLAHLAYRFDAPAVTTGQPALVCSDFRARFDDVRAEVDAAVEAPEERVAAKPYDTRGHAAVAREATGFFRVEEIDGRWWIIDPNGKGFYWVSTDHVTYQGHGCQDLGYAPYHRCVAAKYGSEAAWADTAAERLAAWGFTTLGANNSRFLRHRGFAHTEFLSLGTAFSSVDDICPKSWWTGFPNVFSPKWPRHCDKVARSVCAAQRDDPWLLGYFLDNELEWYGKSGRESGLFEEAWKKPADHTAKQAWIAFLQERLGDIGSFRALFEVDAASWDALAAHTAPVLPRDAAATELMQDWVRLVADRYFSVASEAIRRHDPNHMVIGCRFAGRAPGVWDIAGRYCDIVTFNAYPRIDVEGGIPESVGEMFNGFAEAAQRPLAITEWSFPALDTDRPSRHGAGMRVDTQAQRAQCYEHMQRFVFALPYMVGSSYFMYIDEPKLGISHDFPEDSNYGLVSEEDVPYPELTAAAARLNPQVYAIREAGEIRYAPRLALVDWLANPPETAPVAEPTADLTLGDLRVEGPTDGALRLSARGVPLGAFVPLFRQYVAADAWPNANAGRITAMHRDARGIVIEAELDFAPSQPGDGDSFGFASGWRLWIPADGGWMACQLRWAENTDPTRTWRLVDAYHAFRPFLGGSPEGDVPAGDDIPQHHLRGAAWVDPEAGIGVGASYLNEGDYECYYWVDPEGGFHPDLRHSVDRELAPGERVAIDGPLSFHFPVDGTELRDVAERLSAVRKRVAREAP